MNTWILVSTHKSSSYHLVQRSQQRADQPTVHATDTSTHRQTPLSHHDQLRRGLLVVVKPRRHDFDRVKLAVCGVSRLGDLESSRSTTFTFVSVEVLTGFMSSMNARLGGSGNEAHEKNGRSARNFEVLTFKVSNLSRFGLLTYCLGCSARLSRFLHAFTTSTVLETTIAIYVSRSVDVRTPSPLQTVLKLTY